MTHCDDYCLVAIGKEQQLAENDGQLVRRVGIDLENSARLEPCDWETLFTSQEVAALTGLNPQSMRLQSTLFFSAKESYVKAIGGWSDSVPDFTALQVSAEGQRLFVSVHSLLKSSPVEINYALCCGYVFTLCAMFDQTILVI